MTISKISPDQPCCQIPQAQTLSLLSERKLNSALSNSFLMLSVVQRLRPCELMALKKSIGQWIVATERATQAPNLSVVDIVNKAFEKYLRLS